MPLALGRALGGAEIPGRAPLTPARLSPQVNEVCSPTKPAAPFSPESWYRKAYEESRASSRPTPEGAGSALGSSGTPSPGSGTSSPSSFTGSPGPASPGIGTSSPGSLGGSPGFGTGSPGSGSGGGSSPGSDRGVWCENCNARLVELKRQALKLLLPGPFPGKVSAALRGAGRRAAPGREARAGRGPGLPQPRSPRQLPLPRPEEPWRSLGLLSTPGGAGASGQLLVWGWGRTRASPRTPWGAELGDLPWLQASSPTGDAPGCSSCCPPLRRVPFRDPRTCLAVLLDLRSAENLRPLLRKRLPGGWPGTRRHQLPGAFPFRPAPGVLACSLGFSPHPTRGPLQECPW